MTGAEMIAKERRRQIEKEGWTADHDANHEDGDLTMAAVAYAAYPDEVLVRVEREDGYEFIDPWPWDGAWDKRKKHRKLKRLVIAGALIAAEIDRIIANQEMQRASR